MNALLKPLRPPQVSALNDLRHAATTSKRIMLQAATGFGKTNLFCHLVHNARAKRKRVVFAVPALTLVEQSFQRLIDNGVDPVDVGIMQADNPWYRPHAPIQVATAQTLARRKLPECDLLVVDEAHELHKVIIDWMASEEMRDKHVIGLTATPWSRGLGRHFDTLVKTTPIGELIEDGWLSRFKVFAPTHPDLSGVKSRAGDYCEEQLSKAMDRPELTADIVLTWLSKAKGLPTLCFAVDRAHAKSLYDRFAESGVRCAYVDMHTSAEERTEIGRKLGAGEIEVVCNIGTLTKGVDWIVRCLILARPTKSEILFTQILGRALRPEYAPGFDLDTREGRLAAMAAGPKQSALILDHSDTHLRLGMVTDIDHDELDDGRPRKKSEAKEKEDSLPLPKECTCCGCLIPAQVKHCQNCGAELKLPGPVEGEGELAELVPNGPRKFRRKAGEPVGEAIRRMGEEAVYAQLRGICEEYGRKQGWVFFKFIDLFGHKPPFRFQSLPPVEPSSLIRSWERSQRIAWSHRKDRSEVAA